MPTTRAMRRTLAGLVLLTALVTGCASSSPTQPDETGSSTPAPAFSGPYAAEFTEAWESTDDEFVHAVIEDEQITEMEWAETVDRFEECVSQHGMEFEGFEPDGGYSVDPGDVSAEQANEYLDTCEIETGERWIGYLRSMMLTNPENADLIPLIHECLIREGVVAPDYPLDEFEQDYADLTVPYIVDEATAIQVFGQCNSDPLDLLGDAE